MTSPSKSSIQLEPLNYSKLNGWDGDDHGIAYRTFRKSAERLCASNTKNLERNLEPTHMAFFETAQKALEQGPDISPSQAKDFFEQYFQPHKVIQTSNPGLVTGYFEPELQGSRQLGPKFQVPVHKRPADLVNLVGESQRGTTGDRLTHARKTATGTEPYPTRQQIDKGALAGQNLEILYLADPVEKFFMQIQGSGRVLLDNGSAVRLTYDGKNGLPYTSVGRYLIDRGDVPSDDMTLDALGRWLSVDKDRGAQAMWQNQSYVFFREMTADEGDGPKGVDNTTLIPGRSLAVDTSFHAIGTPIYVEVPTLPTFKTDNKPPENAGFRQLMIAQDVGSAITGPERGDIFFGTGEIAGKRAGSTKHQATFKVLLPITAQTDTVRR